MGSKVAVILAWISTFILYPGMATGASEYPSDLSELSTINLPEPGTKIATEMYDLHMFVMYVCLVIFIGVFGTMLYSVLNSLKSLGYSLAPIAMASL